MKRQKNSSIKAQLLRRAFLSLLLVAVCIIPFAWGQRNAGEKVSAQMNRNAVAHAPQWTNVYGRAPVAFKKSPIAPFLLSGPFGGTCPSTITQSMSTTIEGGGSVACNNGIETTENHYWRAFNMNEFTGGQEYDVTSVDIAIESAVSGGIQLNSVTVNIYANHGDAFPGWDWQSNLVATSGPVEVPDQQLTFPVNIPISAAVATGTLELVLEVIGADGQGLGNFLLVGANSQPETGLSYISAVDCDTPDPVPVGDIGFPNTHWIFNVNGSCPSGSPTPTATATATPRLTPSPRPRPTPAPRP